MKIKQSIAALAIISASTLATMPFASAADNPWYVGISTNAAEISDVNSNSTAQVANVTRRLDIVSDDSTGLGIKAGRTLFTSTNGNKLSIELSYSNSDHDIENIAFMGNDFLASDGRSEGEVEIETVLARAVYQFELGKLNPYLGIGIGQTDFEIDGRYGMSVGQAQQASPPFATSGDSATAIEFRVGAEYSFSDQVGVFLEYSTTDVDDIEFDRRGGGPGGLATTTQSGDFDFDSLNLGVNFRF